MRISKEIIPSKRTFYFMDGLLSSMSFQGAFLLALVFTSNCQEEDGNDYPSICRQPSLQADIAARQNANFHIFGSSEVTALPGHWPANYCKITNVYLKTSLRTFYIGVKDSANVDHCFGTRHIWNLTSKRSVYTSNLMDTNRFRCDQVYESGHVFTVYYYHGSNYFHLHWDTVLPLFYSLWWERHHSEDSKEKLDVKKTVLMSSVERDRGNGIDWETDAFFSHSAYWNQLLQVVSDPYKMLPLDIRLAAIDKTLCFNEIRFGTPKIDFSNAEIIQDFVSFIKLRLNIMNEVERNTTYNKRMGLIKRNRRRRILNVDQLLMALAPLVDVEVVDFVDMSLDKQIEIVQKYDILAGINGAGLMNAIYLPPKSIAIQMIPFNAENLNHVQYRRLLQARGPYLEWQNNHSELDRPGGDTLVQVDETRCAFFDHGVTNNADSFDVTLRQHAHVHQCFRLIFGVTWSQSDVKTVSVVRNDMVGERAPGHSWSSAGISVLFRSGWYFINVNTMSRTKVFNLQNVGGVTSALEKIASLTNVESSPDFLCIAALNTENELSVVQLVYDEEKSAITISDVESFAWHNLENGDQRCSLAVLTKNIELEIHDVLSVRGGLQSKIAKCIKKETIVGFVQSCEIDLKDCIQLKAHLLFYRNRTVLLLINGKFVLIFNEKNKEYLMSSATACLQEELLDYRQIKIAGNFIFHFCVCTATIYIYSFNGDIYTTIDFNQLMNDELKDNVFDVGSLVRFAVTPNADYLIVVDQQGLCISMDLKRLLPTTSVLHHQLKSSARDSVETPSRCSLPSTVDDDNVSCSKLSTVSSIETHSLVSVDSLTSKHSIGSASLFRSKHNTTSNLFWLPTYRKRRSYVTGFNASERAVSGDENHPICRVIAIENHRHVYDVEAGHLNVALWERDDVNSQSSGYCGRLTVCSIRDASIVASFSFSEPSLVLFGSANNLPHLILTEASVDVVSVNVSQEEIISKFMFYENAAVADVLAKLNSWEFIAMPLSVLELALRNHQLDAVAFFLKSQEDVGCECKEVNYNAAVTEKNAVTDIAALLTTTIKENMILLGSKGFAERLIQISLAHFNKILQNTLSVKCRFLNNSCNASKFALSTMTYLVDLRKYLKNMPTANLQDVSSSSLLSNVDHVVEQLKMESPSLYVFWNNWLNMKEEDIIYDAIWNRCLPLAEVFCMKKWQQKFAKPVSFIDTCLSFGLDSVVDCLLREDQQSAVTILSNLGCEAWDKLRELCFNTANKNLRRFLVQKLSERDILTQVELKAIAFLDVVERIYSCRCFERASESLISSRLWSEEELKKLDNLFKLPSSSLHSNETQHLPVGTVGFKNVDNWESTEYCCLTLSWTLSWNTSVWEQIIIDGNQSKDDTRFHELVSPETTWRYLLTRNDLPKLMHWLNNHLLEDLQPKQLITSSMVNDVSVFASPFVANVVLDELAKMGLFCTEERTNLQSLLLRLLRINSDISSATDVFSMKWSSISMREFQEKIIQFCIQHNLPLVLYENMERFGSLWNELSMENCSSRFNDKSSWFPMMIQYQNWIQDPAGLHSVFKASLSNAEFQLGLERPTVNEILKAGSVILGLGTLLCAPTTLKKALEPASNNTEAEYKVDPDLLMSIVNKEYTLASSLTQFVFKQDPLSNEHDITVYNLLRDNIPFDISLLFGWQSTNAFRTSECFPDLPYFSHPELVNGCGHIEDLDFTYYLKQGRPLFAYTKFVSVALFNRQNGLITNKEITDACNVAHSLALQMFYKQEVAVSCVAFIEMLSQNTRGLRIDLQAALSILSHQKDSFIITTPSTNAEKRETVDRMHQEEIAELMMNAVTGERFAIDDVLNLLENAIKDRCTAENISVSSVEGFMLWSFVVMFCRRHNLTLNTAYLNLCAQKNEWIMFALFAEVHKFPKHQVMQAIQLFQSDRMAQHLRNALTQLRLHSIKLNSDQRYKTDKKYAAKDLRANLYARIGVSTSSSSKDQSDATGDGKGSDDDAFSQCGSLAGSSEDLTDHSAASSLTSYDVTQTFCADDLPSDLLGVILHYNQCPNPWRSLLACAIHLKNPVLSIMAACYQEASILDCICGWLYTSCYCIPFEQSIDLKLEQAVCRSWSTDDLKNIITVAIKQQRICLLVEGFYYFQPESPLYDLFRFLKLCIHDKMYEAGSVVLKELQSSLSKITDENGQIIGSFIWFQDTIVTSINEAILLTSTPTECIQFLKILNYDHFLSSISSAVSVPNYVQLLNVLKLLVDTGVELNLRVLLQPADCPTLIEEYRVVLDKLLSQKQFEISFKYVSITGLSKSSVVIAQLREELSIQRVFLAEGNLQARLAIWNHCLTVFKDNVVPCELIVDFFIEFGFKIDHPLERFYVLHLAWTEIADDRYSGGGVHIDITEINKLEQEMWSARIAANVRLNVSVGSNAEEEIVDWQACSVRTPSPSPVKLKSSKEVLVGAQKSIVSEPCRLHGDAEKLALDKIISQELDNGHIDVAYRLTQLFNHNCTSLNIVFTLLKLAEGSMAIHHLDTEMRILLEKGTLLRLRKLSSRRISLSSSRTSGAGSCSDNSDTPPPQQASSPVAKTSARYLCLPGTVNMKLNDDVLEVMEKLMDHCEYGGQCCARIIVCYSIADALGLQFLDIVRNFDDVSLLKVVLQSDFEDRFFLAKEYILSSNVDDTFVASFLCEHIVSALRLYMGQSNDDDAQLTSVSQLILKPNDSSAAFMQLAKLCKDPSLLGSLLLSLMEVRMKGHIQLSLDIELCVRAHSCFTAACHVEGITRSLHKAKKLSKMLTEADEFSLMVRLLTGIGRFSEMTYIFDILRENHQFELLFRKGMEKVPDLKMALLDYVRRFNPVDIETFTMISLHFSMYREIASMLLSDAQMQMSVLNFKSPKEHPVMQESLENIMQLLADAAESYSKADCMQQSINCTKQAELVALQLYLLSANVQIMGLAPAQVSEFIAKHGKFYESMIVAEAYSRHQDWAQALFNNFIVKNNLSYLRDFQEIISFSSSLCEELARRYQRSCEKTNKMVANLKYVFTFLDDLQTKYNLAVDLGFDDVITELLQSDGGSFLKDVVHNRQRW